MGVLNNRTTESIVEKRLKTQVNIMQKIILKASGILVIAYLAYVILFLVLHLKRQTYVRIKTKESRVSIRKYAINITVENEWTGKLRHLSTYRGIPTEYQYHVIDNRSSVWTLKYDNFKLLAPLFFSEHSRQLFFKNTNNVEVIGSRSEEKLRGEIYIVRNGTYSTDYECGYRSDVSHVLRKRSVSSEFWFHKIVPIYTPNVWSFQHFLDSALPKIIQVLHVLKDPNVTLLLQHIPRDKIILEILDALNILPDQIKFLSTREFGADYLYFTCITPPLHPVLWQSARRLIGVPEILDTKYEAYIVFVSRKGCHNCGRVVHNEEEVITFLETRYGQGIVAIFNGGMILKDTIDIFGNSRVIIGSHGGGMYNINFAPVNTTVIELMPTRPDGTAEAASDKIIWSQANLLGQIYWRMCLIPIPGSKSDMVVDIEELAGILDITDKQMNEALGTLHAE